LRTSRIETFSDGVFAIAITLLALDLRAPGDTRHLGDYLPAQWPSYIAYVISFLLIGLVWANHHTMFDQIVRGDRVLLFINTLLLMSVACLPFVTRVLAESLRSGAGRSTAVFTYGMVLVVGGVFFNGVWLWARRGHRLLTEELTSTEARRLAYRFAAGPLLYAVAAVLGLAAPLLALGVYAGLILFYWLPLTGAERSGEEAGSPEPERGS
jgi:uncharacterized membrane protein